MWLSLPRSKATQEYGAVFHAERIGQVSKFFKVRKSFQTFIAKCTSNDRAKKSISRAEVQDSIENDRRNESDSLNTSFGGSFIVGIL